MYRKKDGEKHSKQEEEGKRKRDIERGGGRGGGETEWRKRERKI